MTTYDHLHTYDHTADNYVDKDGCYVAFFCWKWYPERGKRGLIGSKFLNITFLLHQCQFLDPGLSQCAFSSVQLRPDSMQKEHFLSWRSTKLASQPGSSTAAPCLVVAVMDAHGTGAKAGQWHGVASNAASPSPAACASASASKSCACIFMLNSPWWTCNIGTWCVGCAKRRY